MMRQRFTGFTSHVGLTAAAALLMVLLLPSTGAAQTGTVTGTVRDALTLAPIAGAGVAVYTASVRQGGTALTNAAGFFSITGVPAGNYFAIVFPASGSPYLGEVFPDVHCYGDCFATDLVEGTPFVVTSGGTTANRNFNLDRYGAISGNVTNAGNGTPIPNVTVTAATSALFITSALTDASGNYTLTGLPSDAYYLITANGLGFVNEVYDSVHCVGGCPGTTIFSGTPVAVTAGVTATGRNFALETGGRVTGTVTNAATSAPLQNVTVSLVTTVAGVTVSAGSAATDATGAFAVAGLPSGTYYAFTSNTLGFMNEIYDDLLCPITCLSATAVSSGAGIAVTLGQTTAGRNFALNQGGNISGTVLNQTTAAPLNSVTITAVARIGATNYTATANTNAAGNYTIVGLPTGSYRLFTGNTQGFINEIYDNQQCLGACTATNAATTGSPVAVTAGATTTGNDFALQPGGSITGTLTDGATGLPIGQLTVQAFTLVGGVVTLVAADATDSAGVYVVPGLLGGSYFLATSGLHGWRNETYDNIPCLGTCPASVVGTGAPVPVTVGATTAGRNFVLALGDYIQGRVTDSATATPISGVIVSLLHHPSGALVAQAQSGERGVYTLQSVPNGNYVALTTNGAGYVNEIYNNIQCAGSCSTATALAGGTIIPVVAAAADSADGASFVFGANFALNPRTAPPGAPTNFRAMVANGAAEFSWTPPVPSTTGVPTANYVIDAGLSPGSTAVSIPVIGTSHTVNGVPPGVYYTRVRALNAFGSSPPSTEVVLVVGAGATALPEAPTGLTAFMSGTRLTLTWTPAASGGPASGFVIEAGSVTGAANVATLPISSRSFTFIPVPNGYYFLRVRAANAAGVSPPSGEVMIVVGNVASPPGAPNFTAHSVGGSTVTLNWLPPTLGTATSYIIEAGSATGLANLATVNTGNTNVTATFSGVPSGTYYVRLRGVNSLGASVVSNERTIVVP